MEMEGGGAGDLEKQKERSVGRDTHAHKKRPGCLENVAGESKRGNWRRKRQNEGGRGEFWLGREARTEEGTEVWRAFLPVALGLD